MNEVIKVLENRRSCRNFKYEMIKEDELKTIVTADLKESIDDSLPDFNDTANKNSLGFIAA